MKKLILILSLLSSAAMAATDKDVGLCVGLKVSLNRMAEAKEISRLAEDHKEMMKWSTAFMHLANRSPTSAYESGSIACKKINVK